MIFYLLIILNLLKCAISNLSSCYYPDGSLSNDVPCNSWSQFSACCDPTWTCPPNKLCQEDKPVIGKEAKEARGSCTDEAWEATDCLLHYRCMFQSTKRMRESKSSFSSETMSGFRSCDLCVSILTHVFIVNC